MQRIPGIDPALANGVTTEQFRRVEQLLGRVPNAFRVMGTAPAVLKGYLDLMTAPGQGTLDPQIQHQVKLAVSEEDHCDYCVSALSALGAKAGIADADLLAGRRAASSDPKVDAALKFAKAVVRGRGRVADADWDAVRKAGFGDGEITEILAAVILGQFTNYLNNAVGTVSDFPAVAALSA